MSKQQAMDSICKFEVGQVVSFVAHQAWPRSENKDVPRHGTTKAQVIERHVVQCHGGVQVYYLIRPHFNEPYRGTTHGVDFQKVAEIEITDVASS